MDNRRLIKLVGGLVIAAGVAIAILRFFGGSPPEQNMEAAVGATVFGAVIATPGVLALLSLRQRPALVLPAALVLIPLSFLSFSLVTLPLLIPAVLLMRSFVRTTQTGSALRVFATGLFVPGLLLGAVFVLLFAHKDPREFMTDMVYYSTSDVITYWEAAFSTVLAVLASGIGWWLSPTVVQSPMIPRVGAEV